MDVSTLAVLKLQISGRSIIMMMVSLRYRGELVSGVGGASWE